MSCRPITQLYCYQLDLWSEVRYWQKFPLINLFIHVKMEDKAKHLFQRHILFLLTEDLPHDFGRLLELLILFLVCLDVVVAFEIVKCHWDAQEGHKVHPGKPELFAHTQENNESATVENGRWRPKELMVE